MFMDETMNNNFLRATLPSQIPFLVDWNESSECLMLTTSFWTPLSVLFSSPHPNLLLTTDVPVCDLTDLSQVHQPSKVNLRVPDWNIKFYHTSWENHCQSRSSCHCFTYLLYKFRYLLLNNMHPLQKDCILFTVSSLKCAVIYGAVHTV